MTDDALKAIRARAQAISPILHPVEHLAESDRPYLLAQLTDERLFTAWLGGGLASFTPAEAEFISSARADILTLLAEIERLQGNESAFGLGFDAGYQRGAEAMRDIAVLFSHADAEQMRVLPIPERKP